ncbi:MAG: terpene cyclase/mutase family protein [Planctomycetia bacterium]|nr:terpene cyclase/mutase family protein [Planctomycetia bacterium]
MKCECGIRNGVTKRTAHWRLLIRGTFFGIILLSVAVGPGICQEESTAGQEVTAGSQEETHVPPWEPERQALVAKGVDYLRGQQRENGSFSQSPRAGVGTSVIALMGLLRSGLTPDDPTVARGLRFLQSAVREDGGIYSGGGQIASYESCLALACFQLAKEVSGTSDYDAILANGERFLRSQQYSEENGTTQEDVRYGGVGYGTNSRPDLSNTQFFVETLHELGADETDEAIQRALVFVSRCQNLETPANTTRFAAANNDGGFYYTCVGDGESPAGEVNGGLRSYGSITYAGLKSMIYAGLDASDPRVLAASGWLRENYSLAENPGLGRRGLYYYYHTMSKTLDTLGNDSFEDAAGIQHNWKQEMVQALAAAQAEDGSWVNDNRMWMENDPVLVTGYALIVLDHCR